MQLAKPDWNKLRPLGFGRVFFPKMIARDYNGQWADSYWLDSQMQLQAASSVIQYGQSVFEGLKAFQGVDGKIRIFRADYHARRFKNSALRICLPEFSEEFFVNDLVDLVSAARDWVPDGVGESLYLRPTLIGTEGFLGVRPSNTARCFYMASPVGNYYEKGVNPLNILIEEEDARVAPGGLGEAKTGANYAASLRASERAKAKGFDQVLWIDARERKFVEEVGTMNLFFVIGDELITPALSGTILHGCTRDSVITLAKSWGWKVAERAVSLEELKLASEKSLLKEIFGSGTAAVISPVAQLVGSKFTIKGGTEFSLANKLRKEIMSIQNGEAHDAFGWTKAI